MRLNVQNPVRSRRAVAFLRQLVVGDAAAGGAARKGSWTSDAEERRAAGDRTPPDGVAPRCQFVGSVAERTIAPALKVGAPLGVEGSNPSVSADFVGFGRVAESGLWRRPAKAVAGCSPAREFKSLSFRSILRVFRPFGDNPLS